MEESALQSAQSRRFADDRGQARVQERALGTARVIRRIRKVLASQHFTDRIYHLQCLVSQLSVDLNGMTLTRVDVVDRAAFHRYRQHLFETKGLGAKRFYQESGVDRKEERFVLLRG